MSRLERPSASRTTATTTDTPSAAISTWRSASASGSISEREQCDRGDQEDRDLGARGERDLGRELDLAARGDDDRASVLGGVADDRDHDRGEEELAHARVIANVLIEPDQDLGDESRHHRREPEHERARAGATSP